MKQRVLVPNTGITGPLVGYSQKEITDQFVEALSKTFSQEVLHAVHKEWDGEFWFEDDFEPYPYHSDDYAYEWHDDLAIFSKEDYKEANKLVSKGLPRRYAVLKFIQKDEQKWDRIEKREQRAEW